jgi:hypothetical protein
MLTHYQNYIQQFQEALQKLDTALYEIGSFRFADTDVPMYATEIGQGSTKILLTSGTHGEEQAAPFALLEFIKNDIHTYTESYTFTIIPIINPVGFNKKRRRGSDNRDLNRYFGQKITFPENEIVLTFLDNKKFAHHFDMHEDATIDSMYVYESGDGEHDVEILKMEYAWLDHISTKMKVNRSPVIFGMPNDRGIIYFGHYRGHPRLISFGALPAQLMGREIAHRATTLETSGKYPFELRVSVQVEHLNLWLSSKYP